MSATLEQLHAAVGDRYAIERELGRGGTAVVFLARDLKHDRSVAIKVLQPELGVERERFLREIKVAARLRHAHILPLHDSGEADGLLYFVMPYVEGDTLSDRLKRETALSVTEAIRITGEIADALDYAHRQGLVHRDIKPGNILLEEGHAAVADFGIARAIDESVEDRLTQSGAAIGTPAYMSPEQFAEGETIDARTDVYSLACVLYEMIVGKAPFSAPTVLASIAKRLSPGPEELQGLTAVGASALEPVIAMGLAPDPADRYATAGEFYAAAVAATDPSPAGGKKTANPPAIAVLPFANISGDQETEYFADGMSDEIINALTKLESLRVASRTSSFAFKGKDQDIRRIGRQLNVHSVLDGSVRRAGPKLRITAQLVNVADGYHLWSERYDREMTDVFAIQDEITNAIVDTLKVKLVGKERGQLVKQYTDNLAAYQLYLKGRHFLAKRGEGLVRALACFTESIAADPNFATAYAALADTYNILGWWCIFPAGDSFPRAKSAASHALTIAPDLAEAHSALGFAATFYDWDGPGGERYFRRAIELNPGYPTAHHWFAQNLMVSGRFSEGIREAERAQELDPVGLIVNSLVGMAYYFARDPARTVAKCNETLETEPAFGPALFWKAYAQLQLRGYEAALATFETIGRTSVGIRMAHGLAAFAHAKRGNRAAAQRLVDDLGGAELPDVHAVAAAMSELGNGNHAAALDWLERALEHRAFWLAFVGVDPMWEELRGQPRFQAIVERVGLYSPGRLPARASSPQEMSR